MFFYTEKYYFLDSFIKCRFIFFSNEFTFGFLLDRNIQITLVIIMYFVCIYGLGFFNCTYQFSFLQYKIQTGFGGYDMMVVHTRSDPIGHNLEQKKSVKCNGIFTILYTEKFDEKRSFAVFFKKDTPMKYENRIFFLYFLKSQPQFFSRDILKALSFHISTLVLGFQKLHPSSKN